MYRLVRPVDEGTLPATVQAVLSARIDRLGRREKSVLQAAAVIGKEFTASVLGRVVGLGPHELEDTLGSICAAEFVYELSPYPEARYAFKHPLTQEVAYRSQLAERRAEIHGAVARAIVAVDSDRLDERAALLAQHWEAAGDSVEAMRWHVRAAGWSGYRDPVHALEHWRSVRSLADSLGESEEAVGLGLAARLSMLDLGWRLGMPVEEAGVLYAEAERSAVAAGNVAARALLRQAYGSVIGIGSGDLRAWEKLARESFALSEQTGDPGLYVGGSLSSYGMYVVGDYRGLLTVSDRAIELAAGDPNMGRTLTGALTYAWIHAGRAGALGLLGDLDEARRMMGIALDVTRAEGDLEMEGFCEQWGVVTAFLSGQTDKGLDHASKSLAIAERTGSPFSRAWSWLLLGLMQRILGSWQDALASIDNSVSIARSHRTNAEGDSGRLTYAGEAWCGAGEADRGLAMISAGVERAREQGHHFFETYGSIALARELIAAGRGATERARISEALDCADALCASAGARTFSPWVLEQRAGLAAALGDAGEADRLLVEAHGLHVAVGATGHAARLAPLVPLG